RSRALGPFAIVSPEGTLMTPTDAHVACHFHTTRALAAGDGWRIPPCILRRFLCVCRTIVQYHEPERADCRGDAHRHPTSYRDEPAPQPACRIRECDPDFRVCGKFHAE